MLIELKHAGIEVEFQRELPVTYRGVEVGRHRYDLFVEKCLVVELKAIKALEDIHFAQTKSYLKALGLKHGLLLNLATMPLTIRRVIYEPPGR